MKLVRLITLESAVRAHGNIRLSHYADKARQSINRTLHRICYLRVQIFKKELSRNAYRKRESPVTPRLPVGITIRQDVEQDGRVLHTPRDWPNAVERRRQRNNAES